MVSQMNNVKQMLNLDIDDRLLSLIYKDGMYKDIDSRYLEYLGSKVWQFLSAMLAIRQRGISMPGELERTLVSYTTTSCLGKQINLCDIGSRYSTCTDRFQKFIGALYYHMYYEKKMGFCSLDEILNILSDNPNIYTVVSDIISTGKSSGCTIPEKFEQVDFQVEDTLSMREFRQLSANGKKIILKDELERIRDRISKETYDSMLLLIEELNSSRQLEGLKVNINNLYKRVK